MGGNYMVMSVFSTVGKLYGRVVTIRVSSKTVGILREQWGFRRGKGCVDQVFVARLKCEKCLQKGKKYL